MRAVVASRHPVREASHEGGGTSSVGLEIERDTCDIQNRRSDIGGFSLNGYRTRGRATSTQWVDNEEPLPEVNLLTKHAGRLAIECECIRSAIGCHDLHHRFFKSRQRGRADCLL